MFKFMVFIRFNLWQNSTCFSSSSSDTGRGRSKSSSNKVSHGYHLVEGQSGHDMEDYLVAEYRKKKNHVLGLFAIFDGHLGDRVPTYLKDNLFNNILEEVCPSPSLFYHLFYIYIFPIQSVFFEFSCL